MRVNRSTEKYPSSARFARFIRMVFQALKQLNIDRYLEITFSEEFLTICAILNETGKSDFRFSSVGALDRDY